MQIDASGKVQAMNCVPFQGVTIVLQAGTSLGWGSLATKGATGRGRQVL